MPKLSENQTASQREKAYKALRRLLILQQIEPGQRMREPHWAQRLEVHRSALREAFARLAAEGLVERGAKTGYFVPQMTQRDLEEVTKLRLSFECLAIEEVCAQPRPNLSAMTVASDEFARFFEREYSLGVLEADRRFHEGLIEAAQMRRLSALYHLAPLPLLHGDTQDPQRWRSACLRTLDEHRKILAALVARDAEGAKSLLRAHLTQHPILPVCH